MTDKHCIIIGAPIDSGKRTQGCLMGPDSYRTAGLSSALIELGYTVSDRGNLKPNRECSHNKRTSGLYAPEETQAWTRVLMAEAKSAMKNGVPIFLGGDHSLSLGSVAGVANYAAEQNRPQFVLWLDAHTDYHTPQTSDSGHLHGTPLAYVTGRDGFDGFPLVRSPIPEENICIVGLRSVDDEEREALRVSAIRTHDMREIDEKGIIRPLQSFLEKVTDANGALHVSLDVDFLDPDVAPAVGTTVPGGVTAREAHLVMEVLHDSGLITSLDLVELNPFLDERGRTARLMVDLAASAFGRRVFDRPTQVHLIGDSCDQTV